MPRAPERGGAELEEARARFTASAPTCCASVQSKREWIRCSALTEGQAGRLFDEAFNAWFQSILEIRRSVRDRREHQPRRSPGDGTKTVRQLRRRIRWPRARLQAPGRAI
jgi:hypothetical protein